MTTAVERLTTFCQRVDEYITCKNLGVSKFNPEWAIAETFDIATMSCLTQQECFDYAFMLYQLADHVGQERANQENVARWCESSLNSILAQEIDSGAIAKHEMKVARVLLENDLAAKIDEWRQHAQSRLAKIVNREYNIRRKADILTEKGKRR